MRLRRSVDRARPIETLHTEPNGVDRHRYLNELAMHQRRIKHSNRATTLSGASALAVGLVVVLLFLSQILGFNLGTAVALVLVVATILLARALIEFLTKIHIAIGGRRVHQEHRRRPGV